MTAECGVKVIFGRAQVGWVKMEWFCGCFVPVFALRRDPRAIPFAINCEEVLLRMGLKLFQVGGMGLKTGTHRLMRRIECQERLPGSREVTEPLSGWLVTTSGLLVCFRSTKTVLNLSPLAARRWISTE